MIEPSEPSSLLVVRRKVDKKKKKPTTSTTNVDSATITNESLPSSSSSSIPHNSHHETIISSNEIEENEPVLTRSFTLFAQNDHLRLSYELRPLSIADHPITLDPFSQTLVYVTIQLHNKIQDAVIRNIEITLPTRGSIRAMGLSSTQPIIKLLETIDADAKLEHEIKFAIQGPIQSGMTIHGELTYACEYNDKTVSHRHMDWQLAVACADFMINQSTLPHMTPSEFALALANTDQFTHSASALSIELDRVHSQLEFPILSTIVAERVLHMCVVEVVDESASLYGKSVFGWPVAGLIKRHGHLLAMELKSMDKLFIDGLIEQAEAFFSSH
ncbi:hypothetical protein BDF22DRAFT_116267 [Syncephalis plumigaleata]|nr:hypothetical protein BDF22DRAFT_116267 [Syncephalis plumigaleata]